ncbi:MAG TPA: virulence-associated E family protein [Candidatus Defluviicoccus seviourii]|nr:virulence-associated E family protein [Candidatus Defluviicoccus seviourii]
MAQSALLGGVPVADADVVEIQELMQHSGLKRISGETVHDAVLRVAHENAFHPVRRYLEGLAWDGVPRLDRWLSYYLGAEAQPLEYLTAVGRMFLVSMVARIMEPGCKADHMLVLEGEQGIFKSSACGVLGGDWYSDSLPENVGAKDAALHLRGKWLIEVGELHAMSRSDVTAFKSFLTRAEERYRPPYGRLEVYEPRQCVFIGSTNKAAYLKDETGGRRFWPVACGTIDLEALTRDRDLLFAEAVSAYCGGALWWPDRDLERRLIAPEQGARFDHDAWEEAIEYYLRGQEKTSVKEVAQNALTFDISRIGRQDQNRIVAILERLSWKRMQRTGAGQFWCRKA